MLGCPSKPLSCCRWPIVAALILVGLSARGQWTLADPDPGIVAYTNFLGQGLSFVDFNLDGWDDLTLTNASGSLEFHAGGPQGFTPIDLGITAGAGRPLSLMWLDIDNDGDRDFLHTAGMSISLLSGAGTVSRSQVWINVNGTFVDRTEEWGFDGLQNRHAAGMAFHDIEGDGDLDVMVPVYSLPCEGHWVSDNVLFRQDSGAFVDVSMSSAIADGHRSSFQAAWMHLADDELIDLFVINDAGVEFDCDMTNQAYLNNGDWTFSESSEALGLDVSLSSMSITIGDPDGDGLEEIFVTNQEADEFYPYTLETAGFFNRNADGVWVEQAAEVGLDEARWSWSAFWVDQDLDGVEELMVATNPFNFPGDGGEVEFYDNGLYRQTPLTDLESIVFEEDTTSWPGRDRPMHCIVRGDLDGDGDPDGVGLGTGPFATVWINEVETIHPNRQGLTVAVCGTHANSEAIGTRMVLHNTGQTQQRTLRAGEDLFAQHSTTQFFGLGESAGADSLEVFWPDGMRWVLHDVAADSAYHIVEGAEEVHVEFGPVSGDSVLLHVMAPPKWTGIEWNGMESSESSRWALVGEPMSGRVLWFHGLFEVEFAVDWALLEDGISGCTVSVADNYNSEATVDDGSCTYQGFCGPGTVWSVADEQCVLADPTCPPDVNGDGLIGVADILEVLSYYGESCSAVTD